MDVMGYMVRVMSEREYAVLLLCRFLFVVSRLACSDVIHNTNVPDLYVQKNKNSKVTDTKRHKLSIGKRKTTSILGCRCYHGILKRQG